MSSSVVAYDYIGWRITYELRSFGLSVEVIGEYELQIAKSKSLFGIINAIITIIINN